jgi:hypothetical protein
MHNEHDIILRPSAWKREREARKRAERDALIIKIVLLALLFIGSAYQF